MLCARPCPLHPPTPIVCGAQQQAGTPHALTLPWSGGSPMENNSGPPVPLSTPTSRLSSAPSSRLPSGSPFAGRDDEDLLFPGVFKAKGTGPRKIPRSPYKVLDAPALQDDFYLNLVDWSLHNALTVGLGNCMYLWNECSSKHQSSVCSLQEN